MFFQITQLNELIDLLLGDLTKGERQKVNTICTIDVHCRDVVAKMVQQKIESAFAFQWQSQLRHRYYSILHPTNIQLFQNSLQWRFYKTDGIWPSRIVLPTFATLNSGIRTSTWAIHLDLWSLRWPTDVTLRWPR